MSKIKKNKTGVLLVNLGTPDSPSVPHVRKYLREFLMDKRVIDIPLISRWMLVNLIIAPFRAPKSANVYKELWEERGSPLLFHTQDLTDKIKPILGDEYVVEMGMRYQTPSIESALEKIKQHPVTKIIVVPLFPQYASATSGSVHDKVMEVVSKWQVIPEMKFVSRFFEEESFIDAFAALGKKYLDETNYDHVVFSYHGLPERQIKKGAFKDYCQLSDKCCSNYNERNQYCYRAQCFETSRKLAEKLGITEEDYTICFQSRLGKDPWIQPYAEDVIKDLANKGKKKVLAYSPAFVADCLETTIEVGDEFKEYFIEAGGKQWQLVESLNSSDTWVESLKEIILKY